MAEWLEHLVMVLKVPGSEHSLCVEFKKTLSLRPAVDGELTLF